MAMEKAAKDCGKESVKGENFILRCFKGLFYGFAAWFLCFIMGIFTSVLVSGHFMLKLIIGVCSALITLSLYFNWSYFACKRDKPLRKKETKLSKMPFKMAFFPLIPTYVCLIWLYLMKLHVVTDNFSLYVFFNIWIKPFIISVTDLPIAIDSVPWLGIIALTLLTLLKPATVIITYIMTYYEIDLYKMIFYN